LRNQSDRIGESRLARQNVKTNYWSDFPTQSPVCGGDDGLPRELDGITFSKWREESIKGFGNAIVHQVALQIFKAIQQYVDDNQRNYK
jgi:DNA (cytosine-5)-methyltransferase 1